ncbi:hypothetical protein Tco_0404190 [Tanacetum coccineum]
MAANRLSCTIAVFTMPSGRCPASLTRKLRNRIKSDSQLHGDLNRGRNKSRHDSRCIAQNHINTEMNESRTGRHQIADRCIAQNHINTEMNESRTGRQQQIQIDSSRFSQTTADSDSSSRFRQTYDR